MKRWPRGPQEATASLRPGHQSSKRIQEAPAPAAYLPEQHEIQVITPKVPRISLAFSSWNEVPCATTLKDTRVKLENNFLASGSRPWPKALRRRAGQVGSQAPDPSRGHQGRRPLLRQTRGPPSRACGGAARRQQLSVPRLLPLPLAPALASVRTREGPPR